MALYISKHSCAPSSPQRPLVAPTAITAAHTHMHTPACLPARRHARRHACAQQKMVLPQRVPTYVWGTDGPRGGRPRVAFLCEPPPCRRAPARCSRTDVGGIHIGSGALVLQSDQQQMQHQPRSVIGATEPIDVCMIKAPNGLHSTNSAQSRTINAWTLSTAARWRQYQSLASKYTLTKEISNQNCYASKEGGI